MHWMQWRSHSGKYFFATLYFVHICITCIWLWVKVDLFRPSNQRLINKVIAFTDCQISCDGSIWSSWDVLDWRPFPFKDTANMSKFSKDLNTNSYLIYMSKYPIISKWDVMFLVKSQFLSNRVKLIFPGVLLLHMFSLRI